MASNNITVLYGGFRDLLVQGTFRLVTTDITITGNAGSTMSGVDLSDVSLASPTITGTWTAAGATCTDLGTVTTVDINGGTIDGAVIGATTAAAITGTTITATSVVALTSGVNHSTSAPTTANTAWVYRSTVGGELILQSRHGSGLSTQGVVVLTGEAAEVARFRGDGDITLGAAAGAESLRVARVASAAERLQATGATTGGVPTLSAQGAASNLDLGANPKGTGIFTSTGAIRALSGTAIPAGGTAGAGYRFSSTANFGMFFGSGAPSLAAAKGSLYLRSDGSTTNDRAYINTDGSTTWTALTTAA